MGGDTSGAGCQKKLTYLETSPQHTHTCMTNLSSDPEAKGDNKERGDDVSFTAGQP